MKYITLTFNILMLLIIMFCSDPLPITNPWDSDYTGDYRFEINSGIIPDTLVVLAHYNVPVGFGRDTFISIRTDSIFWKKIDTSNYYKNRDNFITIIPLSTDSLRSFILNATTPNDREWFHRDTVTIINPFSIKTSIDSSNKIILCKIDIEDQYKYFYNNKFMVKWNNNTDELVKSLFDSLIIHIKSNFTYSIGAVVSDSFGNTSDSMLTEIIIGDFSKPNILKHPKDTTVQEGDSVLFNVSVTGSSVNFQWQKNKSDIPNAIDSVLSFQSVTRVDSGSLIRCITYNPFGADTSIEAVLSVSEKIKKPLIARVLKNVVCNEGDSAQFTLYATGQNLKYQWYKNVFEILGKDQKTLIVCPTKKEDNNAKFTCIVKNSAGMDTSNEAVLTVHYVPGFLKHPSNITVQEGTSAHFSIEIIKGNPEETSFQWLLSDKEILNANSPSYSISVAALADSGKVFSCVVSNSAGKVTSNEAILSVVKDVIKPKITKQPDNLTVNENNAATFSITAEGTNLEYQWLKNGDTISGANQNSFTIDSAKNEDNNSIYTCVVKNSIEKVESNQAVLTVRSNLKVNFDTNGGSPVEPKVVAYGDNLKNPSIPLKPQFKFAGWYTSQSLKTPFDFTTIITVSLTLYAKWDPVFNVIYHKNGGIGDVPVDNIFYRSGEVVTTQSKGALSRKHYTFAGWNTQADTMGTNYTSGKTFLMGTETINLYAKWRMNAPVLFSSLSDQEIYLMDSLKLKVSAIGDSLNYIWKKDGITLIGENVAILEIEKFNFADTGVYKCIVYNSADSVITEAEIKLKVLTDIEGNIYRLVKIGNQIWMDKDFRKTSGIPRIQDGHEWSSTKDPAYCINPDNNALLYNWFAVTSDNFAPDGWVVPNNNDWSILGDALKESEENRSKFGIKATGGRNPISSGDSQFYDSFESAGWWTSSSDFSDLSDFEREQHGVFYGFNLNNNSISRYCFTNNDGHAVRLIKK